MSRGGRMRRARMGLAPRRAGFTLFEAVVALMIMGLVAVSTLSSVAAQLRAQERAQRSAEVEALAQDRLAVLQLLTAAELQSLPADMAQGQFPPPLQQYTWQAISRPVMGEEYLNDVAVAVNWSGGSYVVYSRIYKMPPVMQTSGQGGQ